MLTTRRGFSIWLTWPLQWEKPGVHVMEVDGLLPGSQEAERWQGRFWEQNTFSKACPHDLMPSVTGFLWEVTPPRSLLPMNPSRVNPFMKLELSFYLFTYAQLFRDQPSTQGHLRSLGNSRHHSTLCLHREQRQYSLTTLCSGSAPSETQRPASIYAKEWLKVKFITAEWWVGK